MRLITLFIFTGLFITAPSLITGNSSNVNRTTIKLPGIVPGSASFSSLENETSFIYDSLGLAQTGMARQTLLYALKGFNYLQGKGVLDKNNILSICDFSQSSKKKRLYIIDMENMKLLLNTYVAHGKNSGSEYPRAFSNTPESLKSSLGFYVTGNTYNGSHGLSLRIQGLEPGFNDKADRRNIVVHGADYVGADFLRYNAFSGRSYGCPAVPSGQTPLVINTIKDGTCLFIYHPTTNYLQHSRILNS